MFLILGVFLLIALVFIGARYLFAKAGIYLPHTLYRILMGIHLCLLLMAISTFILAPFNIYWRGYRSTSIIIIATAITGLLCVWLYKGKPFGMFMVLVFVQTLFAAVIFFDITYSAKETLFYNDNKYRVEYVQRFMSKLESLPDLFIKKGLFERKIVLNDKYDAGDMELDVTNIKNVVIAEKAGQKLSIIFTYTTDTVKVKNNTLIVDVDLNQ